MKKLYRSKNKMLMGVCAGIAEYFNTDPTLIRLIYVLLTVFTVGFPGVIAYIVCGIVIPEDDGII
jgi:phage shock protein C